MGNSIWLDLRLASALTVMFGAHPARSSPASIRLEWHAPLECPQAVSVEEGVDQLLGEEGQLDHDAGNTAGNDTTFSGTITPAPEGGWNLELTVSGPTGTRTRELTGASCHELTEAGVAVIALAPSDTAAKRSESQTPKAVPPPGKKRSPAPSPVTHSSNDTPKDTGALSAACGYVPEYFEGYSPCELGDPSIPQLCSCGCE